MGAIYAEMGDYNQSLLWYERAAQRLLDRPKAMRSIGKILARLGDYGEARVAFEESIRQSNYLRVDDLMRLAICLGKLGKEEAACEIEELAWKLAWK